MMNALYVGLGGFIGSIARYLIYLLTKTCLPNSFPWATLIVNTGGCFAIGIVSAVANHRSNLPPPLILMISVGIIGGFTTFSAFGTETYSFLSQGRTPIAVTNLCLNIGFGLGAIWIGRLFAGHFFILSD